MNETTEPFRLPGRALVLLYALSGYFGFLAVFLAFVLWSVGVRVPQTLDSPALIFGVESTGAALAVNLGLLLVFGLQHSVMARAGFKQKLRRLVPRAAERATFVWVSNLTLLLLMVAWQPLPEPLWRVEGTAGATMLAINGLGWLFLVASTFMVDHWDFIGLRQAWNHLRQRLATHPDFITRFAYRFVRHPMMTGMLVGLWVVPTFSQGHLLLSAGLTVYILIGTRLEERDLVGAFGTRYRRYQEQVPMMIPRPGSSVSRPWSTGS